MVGVVLFLLSVLRQTEVVQQVTLFLVLKMLKLNHIEIITFWKHFSRTLRNIYGLMFLFWHFHLFHFFAQFLAQKEFQKFFFSIIL